MKKLFANLILHMSVFIALSVSAHGQRLCNHIEVKSYSIGEGLSQKMVQNMVQDDDGFIWMATWNGLEKFDGYTFRNFKSYPTDSVRLPYNRLPFIAKGPANGLWCQTYDSCMYIFDTHEERFIDPFALHPGVRACEGFRARFHLPDGVLWLAGRDGTLWRLDGRHYRARGSVRSYQATRPERGETIYDIAPDGSGGEWILSNHGYWVYGKENIHGLKVYRHATAIGGGGLLLTGTDGSLDMYTPAHNALRPVTIGCKVCSLTAPYVLSDGRVMLQTDAAGLVVFDPSTGESAPIDVTIAGNVTTWHEQLRPQGSGIVWALTSTCDVLRIDLASHTGTLLDRPYTDYFDTLTMELIHQDSKGEVWIYPRDGHLCHYNSRTGRLERVYSFNERGRRHAPDISSFMVDDRDNLWGLTSLGIQKITFPTDNSYMLDDRPGECRGLMIDSDGRLWVARKNLTVSLYDRKSDYIGNLTPAGDIVSDPGREFGASLYVMLEDSRKRLWLGSRNHGLFLATPRRGGSGYDIRHYRHSPDDDSSLSNDAVYTVYEDHNGRIWLGTYGGGLNLVEEHPGGTLTFLHRDNGGLPTFPGNKCDKVRYITCSSRGEMMLGTTGGFITFDSNFKSPATIRFYRNWCDIDRDSTLSNNDVLYVCEDSRHDIYLAIMSGGVCKVETRGTLLTDNLAFSYISKRNGLPSDMVYSLREDRDGYLWMAVENALCRYDASTGRLTSYDRYDFHRPLIIGEAPFVIDSEGVATLALDNSVMQVDLPAMRKSDYEPNVVFCDARVLADGGAEESIAIHEGPLRLSPGQRNVTVSFVALDYGNTDNIRYAYRLRGFNDHWIDNGHSHTASFYALPAGDYVLEVKSTNTEGVWNDRIHSLAVHLEPTFIETVWAKLLYLLAFLAIGLAVWYVAVYIMRLQRRIDMEHELTAMKLKFFTDVSHELRTPLTLIINPIDEVMADKSLSPASRDYMAVAKSNTDRMLRLINQFLDIRKIQNRKMKIYLEKIDIVPLLERIHNDFRGLARQKEIDFRFTCPMHECLMYADTDKVEKIVFNLLSNAFKYTPEGRSVSLAASREANMLHIMVRDEGPGIEEWQQTSLFRRFETFGRRRNTPSSGIGLSLVKELTDMLHGRISVSGVKGEGSTFDVLLPCDYDSYSSDANAELILNDGDKEVRAAADIAPAAEATPDDPMTEVLVVEDNTELRMMLGRMLGKHYRVAEACDGQEAIERIAVTPPDIIISDIMMPRVDGLELLRRVRENPEWSHIPFILLSAKASVYERIEGLECGADDYLTKPFSASYLRARLQSLIARRSRLHDYFVKGDTTGRPVAQALAEDRNLPELSAYDTEFVSRLMSLVEEGYPRTGLSIEELAAAMNLGRTVFNRKVKSLLNCTPVELLTSVRVKHACECLRECDITVAEVAYRCGFSSPQYFNRVFRSRYECTPVEWRSQLCDRSADIKS